MPNRACRWRPLGRGARREVRGRGGGCLGVASAPSASSRGRGSRPSCSLRLPECHGPRATTAHDRVTSARRRSPSSRGVPRLVPASRPARLPGDPGMSPRIPSVRRCVPGNAGLPPSPAPPVLMELSRGALRASPAVQQSPASAPGR